MLCLSLTSNINNLAMAFDAFGTIVARCHLRECRLTVLRNRVVKGLYSAVAFDAPPTPRMHRSSMPAPWEFGHGMRWGKVLSPRLVRLTCFVFLKKGHHFFNALLAYKAQPKVAGEVAKSKRKVRIIKSTSCQFLRCNIARQRSLRGGINPG
jgi:hypothetical protein